MEMTVFIPKPQVAEADTLHPPPPSHTPQSTVYVRLSFRSSELGPPIPHP